MGQFLGVRVGMDGWQAQEGDKEEDDEDEEGKRRTEDEREAW